MKKMIENVRLLPHKVCYITCACPSLCIPSAVTAVVGPLLIRISIPNVAVECVLWMESMRFLCFLNGRTMYWLVNKRISL